MKHESKTHKVINWKWGKNDCSIVVVWELFVGKNDENKFKWLLIES